MIKFNVDNKLVYSFHTYRCPIKLLIFLDQLIKNSVWSGDINSWKVCSVAGKTVRLLWDKCGLDLKPTRTINYSLIFHLSWKLLNDDTQCSLLLKKKNFSANRPIRRHFKPYVWPGEKEHIETILENSIWLIENGKRINMWHDN